MCVFYRLLSVCVQLETEVRRRRFVGFILHDDDDDGAFHLSTQSFSMKIKKSETTVTQIKWLLKRGNAQTSENINVNDDSRLIWSSNAAICELYN